jgi:hypothetical protein
VPQHQISVARWRDWALAWGEAIRQVGERGGTALGSVEAAAVCQSDGVPPVPIVTVELHDLSADEAEDALRLSYEPSFRQEDGAD